MFEINILVKKSISSLFKEGSNHTLKLVKKVGEGSYGIIYLTNNKSITVKVLLYNDKPLSDDYDTYYEYNLVEKFIHNKCSFNQIFTLAETTSSIKINKHIIEKGTIIFIMPYLLKIYDYYQVIGKRFFSKETYLLKYMKKLCSIHKDIENLGYLNVDLKGGNIMVDSNEELVLIDYGFFIKYLPDEYFIPKEKYYCWCFEKIRQREMHSFLIGMFILEIIYDMKIYKVKDKIDVMALISKEELRKYYSQKFLYLLRRCLVLGATLNELEKEIDNNIEYRIIGDRKDLPTLYSYICEKQDIKDYKKDAYD